MCLLLILIHCNIFYTKIIDKIFSHLSERMYAGKKITLVFPKSPNYFISVMTHQRLKFNIFLKKNCFNLHGAPKIALFEEN